MKILIFTKYSRLGASSRLRSYQFVPKFEEKGIDCEISSLFNDDYLKDVYSKRKKNKRLIVKAYVERAKKLLAAKKYDLVIIEKELFPYLPATAELLLKLMRVKYIVDYDDAIFHNYDLSSKWLLRSVLGNKIKKVMKYSALVNAGNSYLAQYAENAGAKNIRITPTVIDVENYKATVFDGERQPLIIGWIGSPTTLKYLALIYPALQYITDKYNVEVHIVGGKSGIGLFSKEKIIEWTEASEVDLISQFDIGIMPLENSQWEMGKCGYKLIQYMGCAKPVIASPVGVNTEIVKKGINGILAATNEEWISAIETYINNPALREQYGINGKAIVEKEYNLDTTALKMIDIYKSLLADKL